MNRAQSIEYLVANCSCWKGQGDRDILNSLPDDKLVAMQKEAEQESKAIQVANAAVNGFTDGNGRAFRINPETGQWEQRIVAPSATANQFGDDEEEPDEDDKVPAKTKERLKGKKTPTGNADDDPPARSPRTFDDVVRNASPEVQGRLQQLQQIEAREKNKVIETLIANVGATEKQAHIERLQGKSLDELYYLSSLMPKAPPSDEMQQAAGTTRNRRQTPAPRGDEGEDILNLPTMNWEPVKGDEEPTPVRSGQSQPAANDDQSVEDWMQNAPASVRAEWQSAQVVNARERRKLIDELTANLDEEQEQRVRGRLEKKGVEELRDLLALAPRREAPRPNYFGSQGATPTGNRYQSNVAEDVLPLPTMNWGDESLTKQG